MRHVLRKLAVPLALCVLLALIAAACSSPGSSGNDGDSGESDPGATFSPSEPPAATNTDTPPATTSSDAPTDTSPPDTPPADSSPSGESEATLPPETPDTSPPTEPDTPDPPPPAGEPTIPPPTDWDPAIDPTQVYATPEIPDPTPTPNNNPDPAEGILPHSRVVTYYGHPNDELMGILGEFGTKEEALASIQQLAAQYEAADPSLPVIPAFEVIATVAQPFPGDDGDYLADTGAHIIQEYIDFTAANGMLLILDVQIGHDTIPNQIAKISEYLLYPHVHVALDPEFSTKANAGVPRDRAPGEFIGEVNGHDVNLAVQMLSDFVTQHNLPRKMLIVHQFEDEMIYNKYVITSQPGVDFVLDMDGFGAPANKIGGYQHYVAEELIEYGGIKLFFQQDGPLLSPADVVALQPSPMVVIYQ